MTPKTYSDPNSSQVQLILILYSMEPPIYADLNDASMSLDQSKLKTLGPLAMAMWKVLLYGNFSDKNRREGIDRVDQFNKGTQ